MKSNEPVLTPTINIHAHLFAADHVQPIQLYYMFRGIIGETVAGGTDYVDVMHRGRRWLLVLLMFVVSAVVRPLGRSTVRGFVRLLETVSHLSESDLRSILGVRGNRLDAFHLVRFVVRRVRALRGGSGGDEPFSRAIMELVAAIYERQQELNETTGAAKTQREVYDSYVTAVAGRTRFRELVALSMNFDDAFGDTFRPELDVVPTTRFSDQAEELASLAADARPVTIHPFLAVDPRRYNADGTAKRDGDRDLLDALRHYRSIGFRGIKTYPPLGYLPEDVRLEPLFDRCLTEQLPVITHAGVGGAGRKGAVNASGLGHPYYWIPVMNRLIRTYADAPERQHEWRFRLCLAHFGGGGPLVEETEGWWDEVVALIDLYRDHADLVEIYTDISFNLPKTRRAADRYTDALRRAFCNDEYRMGRLLFGCDWWMYLYTIDPLTYYRRLFGALARGGGDLCGGPQELVDTLDENGRRFLGGEEPRGER